MGKHGPRRRPRDAHGLTAAPAASTVTPADVVAPAHVAEDPIAADVFERVTHYLAARGDLRRSHELPIALLATEWSRHVAAVRIARDTPIVEGSRGPRAHPAAGIAAQAARTVKDLCESFALTPASLGRVDLPPPPSTSGSSIIDKFRAQRDAMATARDRGEG
jgi:phage terminase small subunit